MAHESSRRPKLTATADAPLRNRQPGAHESLPTDIRRSAGNLAVVRALAASGVHAKLTVSQPGDPDEEEADRVADAVVSRSAVPSIQRMCDACSSSKPCGTCEEEEVHAKRETAGSAPSARSVSHAVDAISGSGTPLPPGLRASYESRFGRDFSSVRLHLGTQASASARGIGARAYTAGQNIAFAPGEYRPHDREGQRLLAHELTHVVQQANGATPMVRRGALDPGNTAAWDWFGKVDSHRKDPSYVQTVGAASGAAATLGKSMGEGGAPKNDAERDAFENKAKTLIRLNGIAMVGAHRAELAERKRMFETMATQPAPESGKSGAATENPKAADTAKAIRAAAQAVTKLNADKDMLQGLKSHIESAVRVNAGPDTIKDEYQTLWDNAQPRSSPAILRRVLLTQGQMEGEFWGTKKARLMELARDLSAFRRKQIEGLDAALAMVYEAFPFFADMPAKKVTTGKEALSTGKAVAFGLGLAVLGASALAPLAAFVAHDTFKKDQPPDDQTLLADVQASFDRLLERTDDALIKIGSGDINPLNLPGAVAATRKALPPDLQAEIDRMVKEHEVWEFTKDMIMALGLAVLTGLTGGAAAVGAAAWAAAGGVALATAGVVQVGGQLKDMLDRQTLAGASTSPDGSLLGVTAPSMFEWAVFGVTAVLTAVDLASVAREVSALRPRFNEEPHLPASRTEPKGQKEPGETGDSGSQKTGELKQRTETSSGPGRAQASNAGETRTLEAGRGDKIPSPEQIDSEMAIVEGTPPRKSAEPGYKQEVELPNEHTWRMTEDGHWCRFSNGRICVPGGRGKSAKDLIKSEKDIDKLIEPLRPNADKPPSTFKTGEDEAMWKAYQDYFDERVRAMRTDMRNEGKTTKEMPLKFDAFKKRYTENPELLQLLRGRLAQSETGNIIGEITSGKAAGNLGISAGPNPVRGEVVFPDFVFPRAKGDGFTAVSKKSRFFPTKMTPEAEKAVIGDIREGLDKYYGSKYVRRRDVELTEPGKPIRIDELVVDYDARFAPESIRSEIRQIAEAYEGVDVKIGFFEFEPKP